LFRLSVGAGGAPGKLRGGRHRAEGPRRPSRVTAEPSPSGRGAEVAGSSESQVLHDEIGRMVGSVAESRYAGLSAGERRASLALDLGATVKLRTHKLLPDLNEAFQLLTNVVEVVWRAGFDFDLRGTTGPDFFAYPTIHPHAASDADLVEAPKLMRLENKEYQTSRFRRLHLEMGKRNDGLEVFRVVMYPRVRYDLPIFALDAISVGGRVSFVIADCSPVRRNGDLPDVYVQAMTELRRRHFPRTEMVELPEWAGKVLSRGCVCARPKDAEEVGAFIGYCAELLNFHIECSSRFDLLGEEEMTEVYQCHERYSREQVTNQKTRSVLEASFGEAFADSYMKQTLFDVEPGLCAQPDVSDFEDDVRLNGKTYPVSLGALARVDSVQRGGDLYVPRGRWSPGEEVAMLRLLHNIPSR